MNIAINRNSLVQSSILGGAQILLWGGSYFILAVLGTVIAKDLGISESYIFGTLSLALIIAGVSLPKFGKMIQSSKNNAVVRYAGIVIGCGLIIMGISTNIWTFTTAWIIIGIGMGMGLYDPIFASLGKKFGNEAASYIVKVTLISSLAPSISWLLTSVLLHSLGWRGTCFAYATILIVTIWPIHYFIFSTAAPIETTGDEIVMEVEEIVYKSNAQSYAIMLAGFVLSSIVTTGVIINLIKMLSSQDYPMAEVLAITAFLGPSQAAARLIELVLPRRSPIQMGVVAACSMCIGLLLLSIGHGMAITGVILFGMGNGVRSILRGTLPLFIFGQRDYAAMIGRLARWPMIAQAVTPAIGAYLIDRFGTTSFLLIFAVIALLNIVFSLALSWISNSGNDRIINHTIMNEYNFRKANHNDLPQIWSILSAAIMRRKQDGSNQWQDGYPNPSVIEADITKGVGFVLESYGIVIGYTAILKNDESQYDNIEGKWLSNGDFVVIHRVAISQAYLGRGLSGAILKYVEQYASTEGIYSIKSDTNFDNHAMMKVFDKNGFQYCGQVYFRGSPRRAYEKIFR